MDAPATSIKPAPNALAAMQVVASAQDPTSISASSAVKARCVEDVSIGVYATVAFLSKRHIFKLSLTVQMRFRKSLAS